MTKVKQPKLYHVRVERIEVWEDIVVEAASEDDAKIRALNASIDTPSDYAWKGHAEVKQNPPTSKVSK